MGQVTRRLFDEYEVSDVLGRGGFSVVRRGIRKSSRGENPVAIKTLKRCGQTNPLGLPRNRGREKSVASMGFPTWKQVSISDALLTNEILVMRKIVEHVSPHPNVINLHDVYEDPSGVHLVLELCSGGELFDRIVAQERYSEAGAAAVVKQLAEGLKALHEANIVHRDLKPENCLFLDKSENATLKIMDFGLSSVEEFTDPVVGLFGSIDYVSPEALSQGKIASASDMWSLGVILYILLSGYPPFIAQSNRQKQQMIIAGDFSFYEKTWKNISSSAKQLISSLLTVDPERRPTAQQDDAGPANARMTVAATLSEIELTDNNKLSLFEDGALQPLLVLLSHGDMEMKKVAVKALYNLSSVPQNGLRMIREGAAGPLFELLYCHSLSSPSLHGEVAVIIMHLAISTTTLEADQMHVSLLESEEDIFKLFSLISLTGPDIQEIILRTFHAMCQSHSGLDIRTKLRQLSSVRVLVQLCEFDNHTVRANAVKLFCCLTEDGEDSTVLEHVSQRCIETLLRIIKISDNAEEIASAMSIISNLPKEPHITQWLLDAGALQIIFTCLTDGNSSASCKRQLIENAVGALCRFTVSTNQNWQKEVAKSGFFPILLQFLDSGTALTKRNAAVSLKQFSESSNGLSQPVKKHGAFWCCFTSRETGCQVHLGVCTVESSFCLLEANAVEPLVRVLEEPDAGACEASLDALVTLIDGERLQNGSKLLSEVNAIVPIIRLLSSSCTKLQEKALKALELIFRLIDFKQKYGNLAQMPLVDITQRGNGGMKSLAAKVLAHLDVLQEQSSYF